MLPDTRLTIRCYDRAGRFLAYVGGWQQVTVEVSHNAVGVCEIELPLTHLRASNLLDVGARVVVDLDGQHLLSGPVVALEGSRTQDRLRVTVESWFRCLSGMYAWPGFRSADPVYVRHEGPAESVIKAHAAAAAARLGWPLRVAPDLRRGPNSVAWHVRVPLADFLPSFADRTGLGVDVRADDGAGAVLDVYQPATRPFLLTAESGWMLSDRFTITRPAVTRAHGRVERDPTAGDDRREWLFTEADNPTEDALGWRMETVVDSSGAVSAADLQADALAAIAEARGAASVEFEVPDNSRFGYRAGFELGDYVTAEVAPGLQVTEQVRRVRVTEDQSGFQVSAQVGDDGNDQSVYAAFGRLARAVRKLGGPQT